MNFQKFLEKVQTSGDEVKRIWITTATLIVMTMIIVLWLAFFNDALSKGAILDSGIATVGGQSRTDHGFSFWESIKGGVASVAQGIRDTFGSSREYIVKPPQ